MIRFELFLLGITLSLTYFIGVIQPIENDEEQPIKECGFVCGSGECLDSEYLCDGTVNCKDGSDETKSQCNHVSCASYLFRCDYGACIAKRLVCNGEKDCADNSDEEPPNCNVTEKGAGCRNFEYECGDGQCIDQITICDGNKDCTDGSDETGALCYDVTCQDYLYRCAYGACVGQHARCNGYSECADRSDEENCDWPAIVQEGLRQNGSDCLIPPHPNNGLYQTSGENMNDIYVSNGREIRITCDFEYVLYGADTFYCLNGNWLPALNGGECKRVCSSLPPSITYDVSCYLDGESIDCAGAVEGTTAAVNCAPSYIPDDGDNSTIVCLADGSWSRLPVGCVLIRSDTDCFLSRLANGKYVSVDGNITLENVSVRSNTGMYIICDVGYIPSESQYFLCRSGGWIPFINQGRCMRTCRALYPTDSYTVQCELNKQNVGCEHPVEDTIVKVSCMPHFQNLNGPIPLCKNGEWDPLPNNMCKPECGLKIVNVETLVIGGNTTVPGEYPWIVAIYYRKKEREEQICSGSLISRFFVLSAAHCFTNLQGKPLDLTLYTLVAGKYYRDFYTGESNTQIRKIGKLRIHGDYRGIEHAYRDDIAVIELNESFVLSQTVGLVCVDWENLYERNDFQEDNSGVVAGWGLTTEGSMPAETLRKLIVPYKSMETCKKHLDMDFYDRYLVSDKLCGGYHDKMKNVCKGDSGGGLFFRSVANMYFIRGIVSLTSRTTAGCNSNQYALYTKVSKYLPWLRDETLLKT